MNIVLITFDLNLHLIDHVKSALLSNTYFELCEALFSFLRHVILKYQFF